MTVIFLVRHGENDWVKKHRLAGWLPGIRLNGRGRRQARKAAKRLAAQPVAAVYSSPVLRCVETAEIIADKFKLPVICSEALGEVRYGKWEGKKIKKLAGKRKWQVVQFFPSRMRFPDGEALREVQFRAIQEIEQLSKRHGSESIVAVSHADVIKLVLAHYLGVHIDLFQRISVSPASVSVLHLAEQGFVRVLRVNDDGPFAPAGRSKDSKAGKQ